jgi:hypothetical protein
LGRHGIPLSRKFVIDELAAIHASNYDLEVVREVLEKRPLRDTKKPQSSLEQLNQSLIDLDTTLSAGFRQH